MNTFGHAGLTLAAVYAVEKGASWWMRRRAAGEEGAGSAGQEGVDGRAAGRWFPADYRLVMLGSVLPDLIDKPLGFSFASELVNGAVRSVGHTLLFAAAVVLTGLAVRLRSRRTALLLLAFASAGHLVLDRMWEMKDTVLWPFMGLEFPRGTTTLQEWILFHSRFWDAALPELAGFAVICFAAARVILTGRAGRFISRGEVP